jgi:hypothetical protein
MKIGFKVVDSYKESLVAKIGSGRVHYGDFWTTPKPGCGPLAVFSNIADARAFAYQEHGIVFKCVYIPEDRIRDLFVGDTVLFFVLLPKGTKLARAVHLLVGIVYDGRI